LAQTVLVARDVEGTLLFMRRSSANGHVYDLTGIPWAWGRRIRLQEI
jgi:hypothetical protein